MSTVSAAPVRRKPAPRRVPGAILVLLLAVAAVHADDATEMRCSLTTEIVSGTTAGLLYCSTVDKSGATPILLMCEGTRRVGWLEGGALTGEQAEVAVNRQGAEPVSATWTVKEGESALLSYEAAEPDGDDVIDALLGAIAEGSPLDYAAGDLAFHYTFQPHHDRVTMALRWERICGLFRQAEDS